MRASGGGLTIRLSHFALAVAAVWIVVGLVWGLDAAVLYFFFAVIVMLLAVYSSERGRLTLRSVLWGVARIAALVVGVAWHGFWVGFAFLMGVIVLQSVAMAAEALYLRRAETADDPGP